MKEKGRSARFLRRLIAIALLIAAAGETKAQQAGETVARGPYSLSRAEAPARLVAGIALPELTRVHFSGMSTTQIRLRGRWGRAQTLFRPEDRSQVRITVAVYGSVTEAEDSALALLEDTSAMLQTGSHGGGVIGTHSWYLRSPEGSGTVVFIAGNSLFQLFSSSYEMAEAGARSILVDLERGTNGVRLGQRVSRPVIDGVSFRSRLEAGAEVQMTIEASDPNGREIAVFGSSVAGQLLETPDSREKIFIPQARDGDIQLYVVNDLNVVSPVFIQSVELGREE